VSGSAPAAQLYNSETTYKLNDFVYDSNNIYYKSLVDSNKNELNNTSA
jgi:hypothetical protein